MSELEPTTPEQLPVFPEDEVIANFHNLTPELLVRTGEAARQQAQEMLQGVRPGEDGPVEGEPEVLWALRETSTVLGAELGEVGIVYDLIGATHPDETVRDQATAQQAKNQEFSDGTFVDPNAIDPNKDDDSKQQHDRALAVRTAFAAIDPTTLTDPRVRQVYDHFLPLLTQPEQSMSQETAETLAGLRKDLREAQNSFAANNSKMATVEIPAASFSQLPAELQGQLSTVEQDGNHIVQLSESALNALLEKAPRDIRREAWTQYYGLGENGEAQDQLIQKMADLRLSIAKAEGKETWTELQVEGLTLDTPAKVLDFYNSVKDGVVADYQRLIAKIQPVLEAEGLEGQVQEYDIARGLRLLAEQGYDASKVTYSFDKVTSGLWSVYQRMFNVTAVDATDQVAWAPGVRAFNVHDNGSGGETSAANQIATIICDPYSRSGKRNGGATYGLRYWNQEIGPDGKQSVRLPMAATVTNFTAPNADGTSAKMTAQEVKTHSHETYGHGMNNAFAHPYWSGTAFDKLPFDVIEVWSQAFEYLPDDPKMALMLADEGIPANVAQDFLRAQETLREDVRAYKRMRLFRGMTFDLAMHNSDQPNVATALEEFTALTEPAGTDAHWVRKMPHLANSYAGRYGTYLYDDGMAYDIARWMQANNYSQEVGQIVREAMELGGTKEGVSKLLAVVSRARVREGAGTIALNSDVTSA
jgi:Zn-dependent oligopeptidase